MKRIKTSRLVFRITIPLVAVFGIYSVCQYVRQELAQTESLSNCQDNGIGAWGDSLAFYAKENGGRLPNSDQRIRLEEEMRATSSHFAFTCNQGGGFIWNPTVTKVSAENAIDAQPVVWCAKPHGVTYKWRNVIFSDLTQRKVPEAQVVNW